MMNPDDAREQELWDRCCAAAPRCSRCGGSVYPHDTYAELGDFVFCEPCWRGADTFYCEDLEFEF
jgi:hypothetical protein